MKKNLRKLSIDDYKYGLSETLTKAVESASDLHSELLNTKCVIDGIEDKKNTISDVVEKLLEIHKDILCQTWRNYKGYCEGEDTDNYVCCDKFDANDVSDDELSDIESERIEMADKYDAQHNNDTCIITWKYGDMTVGENTYSIEEMKKNGLTFNLTKV